MEGVDGSGKTTVVESLRDKCKILKYPGYTGFGSVLREFLLFKEGHKLPKIIKPHLMKGDMLLTQII